ncbi:hypothetical protein [Anabaena lutea]|uniref:Uncharacterized protein n=1 Tax=Anabaena lutea FACHB-196 TaxID=2692881 RepID=A0ABR8FML9_9NOST|nr:hypothetical protein [Anabaena lutea]MBD2571065.1 hypothetical protein [Anabaena lutea FACHB-196]
MFAKPQKGLVPIGNNFYATPNTPQKPKYYKPFAITNKPLGIGINLIFDGCNIGLQATGFLLWMALPSFQILWRNPSNDCTPPPSEDIPEATPPPNTTSIYGDGFGILCHCTSSDSTINYFIEGQSAQRIKRSITSCTSIKKDNTHQIPTGGFDENGNSVYVLSTHILDISWSFYQNDTYYYPLLEISPIDIQDSFKYAISLTGGTQNDGVTPRYAKLVSGVISKQGYNAQHVIYLADSQSIPVYVAGIQNRVPREFDTTYSFQVVFVGVGSTPPKPPPPPPPEKKMCDCKKESALIKILLQKVAAAEQKIAEAENEIDDIENYINKLDLIGKQLSNSMSRFNVAVTVVGIFIRNLFRLLFRK